MKQFIKNNIKQEKIEDLNNKDTLLVTVDMINGFIREGALASSRIENIVPKTVELNSKLTSAKKIFFVDEHEKGCLEFNTFPEHCLKGTFESEIISELKPFSSQKESLVIPKNSVNGFMTKNFINYFENNIDSFKNIIVCGCCSDICITNFCLNIRTALNQLNKNINVKVVVNAIDTYDAPNHIADEVNEIALYIMMTSGVELIEVL